MISRARPVVLVIAGSDSSGGAGIVRDVQTLTDLGADALCVITAVTAQCNRRVTAVHAVPPEVVRAQIEAAYATRRPDAVKIGMLASRATVEAVADALGRAGDGAAAIVLDPVLASSSGGVLLDEEGRQALKERLIPLATLLTPNVPEAAALLGEEAAAGEAALDLQAERLLGLGAVAVLLKGGHADEGDATDRLAMRNEPLRKLTAPRVRSARRGTGCALASAIAARLAGGRMLLEACQSAKEYVRASLLVDPRAAVNDLRRQPADRQI
ncbi:MAG: bifunctional hydroxymethylpyrimidine kinase/phosphomethylpyrimidine kinase [Steroidobacteraceae bacterium]